MLKPVTFPRMSVFSTIGALLVVCGVAFYANSQAQAAPVSAGDLLPAEVLGLDPVPSDRLTESGALLQFVHDRRYRRHYHRRHHGPRFRYRRPGFHYYNGWWYSFPWWVPVPPRAYRYSYPRSRTYYRRSHVNWCRNRYRSYNPRTDLWFGYDGRYHRCISPYSR